MDLNLAVSVLRRKTIRGNLLLLAAAAAGAAFRFYQIGHKSLWLDEAFSVWLGGQPVSEIIRLTIDIDQHPPLYSLLLHAWMRAGGSSEAWVRSLSALCGVLTIFVVYALAKTLAGRTTGLLAAVVLAFSPFHVIYSQEARGYALLALTGSTALWMTARLLTDPCARTMPIGAQAAAYLHGSRAGGWRALSTDLTWAGYMLFTALVVYGHNTAVFLPIGVNLFVLGLMFWRRHHPARVGQLQPPALRSWIAAQAGAFLLWLPWLPGFYRQAAGMVGDFWIQKPTAESVVEALKTFLLAGLPDRLTWQWLIWLAYACVIALALVRWRRTAGHFVLLAALFLVPFLGELLISLWQPVFSDRTLIWATTPLIVLLSAGIAHLRHRAYLLTASLMIITLSWISLSGYYTYYEKERWDLAAGYIAEQAQADDIIIFNAGWSQLPFNYYFARHRLHNQMFGAPVTLFERGELEPRMTESDLPRLRELIQGRRRVWLVYSHNWWTDPKSLIPAALGQQLRLIDNKMYNGMRIQLYSRR